MSDRTLILAPIRGITDVVYRGAFARCFSGFDRAIAPFINLRRDMPLRPGEQKQMEKARNQDLPTVPQVHTNHARTLARGLAELAELGCTEVNWNLGCPHPMVAKRKRGAGMLPHPEFIDSILAQAMDDCPVKLSAKIRLGYRNPDEFIAVLDVLNKYPLTEVILHPRTASQIYDGVTDVDRAVIAFEHCAHPFVYNGDIRTPDDLQRVHEKLPDVTTWMVGRGSLDEPFLPSMLKGALLPSDDDQRRGRRKFHEELFQCYEEFLHGPGHLLNKMKEHWRYLIAPFAPTKKIWRKIRRSRDLDMYRDAVNFAFDQPFIAPEERNGPRPLLQNT